MEPKFITLRIIGTGPDLVVMKICGPVVETVSSSVISFNRPNKSDCISLSVAVL